MVSKVGKKLGSHAIVIYYLDILQGSIPVSVKCNNTFLEIYWEN